MHIVYSFEMKSNFMFKWALCFLNAVDALHHTTPKGFSVSSKNQIRTLSLVRQMCNPLHYGANRIMLYTYKIQKMATNDPKQYKLEDKLIYSTLKTGQSHVITVHL